MDVVLKLGRIRLRNALMNGWGFRVSGAPVRVEIKYDFYMLDLSVAAPRVT